MVDRLETPRIVDSLLLVFSFFLLHDEMTLAVSKDALCFVKQRENQIVLTIGALLHYTNVTNVKLQIRTSCLLFTVSPLYFLEIREEA